jgi:hypothetical protein
MSKLLSERSVELSIKNNFYSIIPQVNASLTFDVLLPVPRTEKNSSSHCPDSGILMSVKEAVALLIKN